MTNNLKEFFKGLDKQQDKIKESINDILKEVTEEIFNTLLLEKYLGGTPKITGFLRSNYIITTDSKYSGVVGSPQNVSKSKRESNLQKFLDDDKLFEKLVIYINNNTPYGHLVDAVQNFRERGIQSGEQKLKRNRNINDKTRS